jgi:6-phosphogluconolactonase/glucosamine-6-phosphate isomerase/deaminase
MRVIVTENFDQTCEIAAGMIVDVIRNKPDARLGLATGSTAQGYTPTWCARTKRAKWTFPK